MGDAYAGSGKGAWHNKDGGQKEKYKPDQSHLNCRLPKIPDGLKNKDLMGLPWMVAFALRNDGWWLRQDIIWSKLNPKPESVTYRCTKSHEYIFLMGKDCSRPHVWRHKDGRMQFYKPEPDVQWMNRITGDYIKERPDDWQAIVDDGKKWRKVNLWQANDYYFDFESIMEAGTGRDPGNKGPTKAGRKYLDGDKKIRNSRPWQKKDVRMENESQISYTRVFTTIWIISCHWSK